MSAVLTPHQAAAILRRPDLPGTVYWSWFTHETDAVTGAYEAGSEDAAREMRALADRLIRDAGGDPMERP